VCFGALLIYGVGAIIVVGTGEPMGNEHARQAGWFIDVQKYCIFIYLWAGSVGKQQIVPTFSNIIYPNIGKTVNW